MICVTLQNLLRPVESVVTVKSTLLFMGRYNKSQTKQLQAHTHTHCMHNRWWLVLGWVTTKEDHLCLRFIASLPLTNGSIGRNSNNNNILTENSNDNWKISSETCCDNFLLIFVELFELFTRCPGTSPNVILTNGQLETKVATIQQIDIWRKKQRVGEFKFGEMLFSEITFSNAR